MKKANWITTFAAMAASLLWFTACQKEMPVPGAPHASEIAARTPLNVSLDMVPVYHRQALDYMAAHCDFTGLESEEILAECVRATGVFLCEELGCTEDELEHDLATSLEKIIEIRSIFEAGAFMPPEVFETHLDLAGHAAGLSPEFRAAVLLFYIQSIDPAVGTDDMDSIVEEHLNPAAYTGPDRDAARVFRGIWDDSKVYWNNGNPVAREKGCPYWEYANDAIGGLFGLALGPAGSIILGAAASAYTHWECN